MTNLFSINASNILDLNIHLHDLCVTCNFGNGQVKFVVKKVGVRETVAKRIERHLG